MALDLRLQQKLAQTLVMTPQLQQAIKLLQLSHLEMADVLREELEQNPLLEEHGEEAEPPQSGEAGEFDTSRHETDEPTLTVAASEPSDYDDEAFSDAESQGEGDSGGAEGPPAASSGEAEQEVDWEAYLDTYSNALPGSAGGAGGDELPSFEATYTQPTTLREHLRWQAQMAQWPPDILHAALLLIEEVDDDGYLGPDAVGDVAEELATDADTVSIALGELQGLEPPGVAARDLRECLLLQLRHLHQECPTVKAIVSDHLGLVERHNVAAIARHLQVSVAEVTAAVRIIRGLEPLPGRRFVDRAPQYITPDIYVHKVAGDYVITLNEDGLPRLRVSHLYRDVLATPGNRAKSYIQDKMRSAAWLIRSIHMRQRTIYRVMESILKFQRTFFDKGVAHLKPLVLKVVADDVGMHESTISRVTTNKYVHTPQGIYELKFFFNSSIHRVEGDSIASESVRNHIGQLIGSENPRAPYSDQRIVEILKGKDIDIARRTVAKYRDMLKIPSSSKRKRVF